MKLFFKSCTECFKRNVTVFVKRAIGKNNEGGNTENCTVTSLKLPQHYPENVCSSTGLIERGEWNSMMNNFSGTRLKEFQ